MCYTTELADSPAGRHALCLYLLWTTRVQRRYVALHSSPDIPPPQMLLTNLTTNSEYELYTQALTSSLYREDLVYPGLLSETHTLTVNRSVLNIRPG